MQYDEIIKTLQYYKKESAIYMPNEIFRDLQNNIKKSLHIPFAYSYYYLVTWLYRYAKYGSINVDNKDMKEILGYNKDYKPVDYIIKKNGILDLMEYTYTAKDYPISWEVNDNYLNFSMLSDFDEETIRTIKETKSRKYTIKFPNKAFFRTKESQEDNYEDGTFYDISTTHLVPFEVFTFCMDKKEIGCTGFYLWSYLKMKNQIFTNGYDISLPKLSKQTGISYRTMCEYLSSLRKYNLIQVKYNQEYFSLAIDEKERKANTYITNEYESFSLSPIKYEKMKILKTNEYYELIKRKHEEFWGEQEHVDIPLDKLPY
jgi:hypothetical protein